MSRKILNLATGGLAGKVLGKKKKKEAEPAAAATQPTKGPKITPLGAAGLPLTRRSPLGGTLLGLSDRLGG